MTELHNHAKYRQNGQSLINILPTGLYILPSVSFFFQIEQRYLRIYCTDFHDFFTKWKVLTWMLSIRASFSDSSWDDAMATNFWQNWQNDLHSAPWHFKTEWNIAIWISSFIATMITLHRVQIWWTS